jgi:hypothetical protein
MDYPRERVTRKRMVMGWRMIEEMAVSTENIYEFLEYRCYLMDTWLALCIGSNDWEGPDRYHPGVAGAWV